MGWDNGWREGPLHKGRNRKHGREGDLDHEGGLILWDWKVRVQTGGSELGKESWGIFYLTDLILQLSVKELGVKELWNQPLSSHSQHLHKI